MARMVRRPPPVAVLLLALGLSGCVVDKGLSLSLETTADTTAIASTTVRVYRDRCPTRTEMILDQDAALGVAYDETGAPGTLPPIGELDPRTWSFAALGRGGDCAPLLFGCADADVTLVDRVMVTLDSEPWAGAVCGPMVGCAMGACTGPPTTCDPTAPDGCPPCADADLTRDASHCGACGHACPTDLLCASSLCRPSPRPVSVLLRLEGRAGEIPADLTGLWVAIAWAPIELVAGGTTTRVIEVTHAQALESPGGTAPMIEVRLADVMPPVGARTDLPDGASFATAQIVLTRDTDGDGSIGVRDLPTADGTDATEAYGVGDVALAWSDREVGRGGLVDAFAPEGLLEGLAAYQRGPTGYVPAPADTVFSLQACLSSSGAPADPSCIASLPTPLQP